MNSHPHAAQRVVSAGGVRRFEIMCCFFSPPVICRDGIVYVEIQIRCGKAPGGHSSNVACNI